MASENISVSKYQPEKIASSVKQLTSRALPIP